MSTLAERIANKSAASVHPAATEFAARLATETGASAVLFYGSNLRTGSLEGVLDYYVLLPGEQRDRIWPQVNYREWEFDGQLMRAKIATMSLKTFAEAARGELHDTTIWARFVQPSAIVWSRDDDANARTLEALCEAAQSAARLAVALGPENGTANDYWRALFQATYDAEFRFEKAGRENSILSVNADHFDGLLLLALEAQDITFETEGRRLTPKISDAERKATLAWWKRRKLMSKPLNVMRLIKAATTFEGASRYAAWKIERHTGIPIEVTPWRERHPLLATPGVLLKVWLTQRKQRS